MLDEVIEVCKYGYLDTLTNQLPGEEFLDIPGYEELYQVSNYGRVWSIRKQKFLSQKIRKDNRLEVSLYKGYGGTSHLVHTLVLLAFCGSKKWYEECRHLDDNTLNNNLNNLEWGSHIENCKDRKNNGTSYEGENHNLVKLTNEEVIKIRDLYDSGKYTQKELAYRFDVSREMIGKIIRFENWTHI